MSSVAEILAFLGIRRSLFLPRRNSLCRNLRPISRSVPPRAAPAPVHESKQPGSNVRLEALGPEGRLVLGPDIVNPLPCRSVRGSRSRWRLKRFLGPGFWRSRPERSQHAPGEPKPEQSSCWGTIKPGAAAGRRVNLRAPGFCSQVSPGRERSRSRSCTCSIHRKKPTPKSRSPSMTAPARGCPRPTELWVREGRSPRVLGPSLPSSCRTFKGGTSGARPRRGSGGA